MRSGCTILLGAIFLGGLAAAGPRTPAGRGGASLLEVHFDDPPKVGGLAVTRTILARRLSSEPTVDGRLGDDAWQDASVLGPLVCVETMRPAPVDTVVRLGHFRDVLYVGARCAEPEARRRDPAFDRAHDPRVWSREDDGIEILLDSRLERRGLTGIGVSRGGACVIYSSSEAPATPSYESGCRAAVSFDDEAWSVEVAVPRSILEVPANDLIGFNFVRRRPGTREGVFTWNPAPAEFAKGRWLGTLSFETFPCSIAKVEVGWPRVGVNRIRVWIRNVTDEEQALRAGIITRENERRVNQSRYRFTVAPREVTGLAFSHRIVLAGPCDLGFVLADDATGETIARFLRPGLHVARSGLVMEAEEGGDGHVLRWRFRIHFPRAGLSELKMSVTLRRAEDARTVARVLKRSLPSRGGEVIVRGEQLDEGEYQLDGYLWRSKSVVARARNEFAVPPKGAE